MPLDPTRLKALRIESGLTARRLQREAGLTHPTLYRLESGERGEAVTVALLEQITVALSARLGRRVSVEELLRP